MILARLMIILAAVWALLPAPALADNAFTATRFSVQVSGSGPDVILIPGLTSSPKVYDGVLADLEKTHKVHRIQIAGFAGLAAGVNATGEILPAIRDELIGYMQALKLEKPAIVGHSLGGLLALMVAAKAPDQVSRVLIVDALPFYALLFNPMATAEMTKPFAEQAKARILAMTPEQFAEGQKKTAAILARSPEGQARMIEDSMASDRAVMAEAMYEDMLTDVRPDLAMITAPVTVLQAYDPAMPMKKDAYADLWKTAFGGLKTPATMILVEDSRHFIMFDQPAAFAKAVSDFLAK